MILTKRIGNGCFPEARRDGQDPVLLKHDIGGTHDDILLLSVEGRGPLPLGRGQGSVLGQSPTSGALTGRALGCGPQV